MYVCIYVIHLFTCTTLKRHLKVEEGVPEFTWLDCATCFQHSAPGLHPCRSGALNPWLPISPHRDSALGEPFFINKLPCKPQCVWKPKPSLQAVISWGCLFRYQGQREVVSVNHCPSGGSGLVLRNVSPFLFLSMGFVFHLGESLYLVITKLTLDKQTPCRTGPKYSSRIHTSAWHGCEPPSVSFSRAPPQPTQLTWLAHCQIKPTYKSKEQHEDLPWLRMSGRLPAGLWPGLGKQSRFIQTLPAALLNRNP